jgi:hypothetical protein
MYPFWILGVLVILSVLKSGKKFLLRVKVKPVLKWCAFLIGLTVVRVALLKLAGYAGIHGPPQGLMMIPWAASLTVFWEDVCHGLPLVILQKLIGRKRWWAKALNSIALSIVMLSFGLGHLYQGPLVALLLCFYIPYSMKLGKQYGFGTVMVCHTLYDLVTFLFVKFFLGA